MKTIKYLAILLFVVAIHGLYAQEYKKLDAIIGLSDTIKNSSELRIYKKVEITNYNAVFTLSYNETTKIWMANLYEVYLGKPNRVVKINIDPSKSSELLWLKILVSNIADLPEKMSSFEYKLNKKTIVKEGDEYQIRVQITDIVDGDLYEVRYKSNKINKEYRYSNPESYLKEFPDVDELKTFMDFITTVEEFLGRKL